MHSHHLLAYVLQKIWKDQAVGILCQIGQTKFYFFNTVVIKIILPPSSKLQTQLKEQHMSPCKKKLYNLGLHKPQACSSIKTTIIKPMQELLKASWAHKNLLT